MSVIHCRPTPKHLSVLYRNWHIQRRILSRPWLLG